jgi:hypothetical protein
VITLGLSEVQVVSHERPKESVRSKRRSSTCDLNRHSSRNLTLVASTRTTLCEDCCTSKVFGPGQPRALSRQSESRQQSDISRRRSNF